MVINKSNWKSIGSLWKCKNYVWPKKSFGVRGNILPFYTNNFQPRISSRFERFQLWWKSTVKGLNSSVPFEHKTDPRAAHFQTKCKHLDHLDRVMRSELGTISLDNRQSDVRIWAKWAGHPFEGLLHHKHHGEDHDKDEDVFDETRVQGRVVRHTLPRSQSTTIGYVV